MEGLSIYGELSILGYNGYIPSVERNGRKNRSKFLLCKRPEPNGIKKSRHYIVKQQPQATKAIQDKETHSISYTFSRSQTIIVEYRLDENTDMFQIGRSTEDPIDFVVMDTLGPNIEPNGQNGDRQLHNENNSSSQQRVSNNEVIDLNRLHRNLAKVGEDLLHYGASALAHDPRGRSHYHRHQAQAVLLNYPQPNISNLPPLMANHFRNQDASIFHHNQVHHQSHHHNHGHSSGSHQQHQLVQSIRPNVNINLNDQHEHCSSNHNLACKRSHATQSTISRFACRILVDRSPPYTARIYAAGFDSSKNIFLGEKATKWEQNSSIDGLTTNGVLLMHPKKGQFYEKSNIELNQTRHTKHNEQNLKSNNYNPGDINDVDTPKLDYSNQEYGYNKTKSCNEGYKDENSEQSKKDSSSNNISISDINLNSSGQLELGAPKHNDSNNNSDDQSDRKTETGGVWREVSVDGGIYAIRESRSAPQKGTRIESESNVLQDGTLIDLCGATLLWRSVDGFRASPTKKSLEEKLDILNASRPQCPVGLNTLVIPRKPVLPMNHQHILRNNHKDHHQHGKDIDKHGHQPYVYLKCGHVQGYHDWGTTDKSNQRTCPICLSVGTVAKLSMGLEPSFYVDSGPLTHVFNPCGHMASERTVNYWCSIKIPHGTHFFHSVCPFCATPVATAEPPSTKLIFQDDLD